MSNFVGRTAVSLEKISQQLEENSDKKLPPVELWDPPYCGEIDLQIKGDGSWYYNGTVFKRLSLVKLFASVLKKEDEDYYLVTPVEKVKIQVDDVPFVLTQWDWQDEDKAEMRVSTNLDDKFMLNAEHPVTLGDDGSLYVIVRRNLLAKVHRNVYYQWIDIAKEEKTEHGTEMVFYSAGQRICLGLID